MEFALAEVFAKGGEGGMELAEKGVKACEKPAHFAPIYDEKLPIKEKIETIARTIPTPLVLHGGSGLSDEDFRESIRRGISKVNIFTDLNLAGARAAQAALAAGATAMTELMEAQVQAIQAAAEEKMCLFGAQGRA